MAKDAVKRYKLGEQEFFVALLNVNQDVEIARILRRCGVLSGEFTADTVIAAVTEHDELHHFLATILVPVNGKFEKDKLVERMQLVGELDSEMMVEVIQDFFGKNGSWAKKLEGIFEQQFPSRKAPMPEPTPPATTMKNF